jgi:hypothetical protein
MPRGVRGVREEERLRETAWNCEEESLTLYLEELKRRSMTSLVERR